MTFLLHSSWVLDAIKGLNGNISTLLQTKLINNHFFIINLWSIVHFFSGLLIMLIINLKFKKVNHKYLLLFLLLILWELFEFFIRYVALDFFGFFIFKSESVMDIGLDIVFGMFGAIFYCKFVHTTIFK